MGRTIIPKNKIARRFGINLGLKSNPTKVARRLSQTPGVHGPKKRRVTLSSFGKQLAEKQKAKLIYGIREKQFSGYIKKASTLTGDSGVNLQKFLEMRMDNVIYRLGFGITRAQARQLVSHNLFSLNGKKMNIPSHIVKIGDEVALKENRKNRKIFENISEKLSKQQLPSWLTLDPNKQTGKVVSEPQADDFEKTFDVKLIIEYYSSR